MNKPLSETDLATPKVTTGPISGSRKIYARPDAAPELKVPLREIALDASSGEPPVPVYDPSGPYTDPDVAIDVESGLPARALNGCTNAAASRNTRAVRSSRSTMATSTGKHLARNFPNTPRPLRAVSGGAGRLAAPSPNSNGRAPALSPRR